jgi:hypothetical protein
MFTYLFLKIYIMNDINYKKYPKSGGTLVN